MRFNRPHDPPVVLAKYACGSERDTSPNVPVCPTDSQSPHVVPGVPLVLGSDAPVHAWSETYCIVGVTLIGADG